MNLQSPKHFKDPAPKLSPSQLSFSTAELYQELEPANPHDLNDPVNHFGPYKAQRTQLDYSYHYLPDKSRQLLQDSIVHVALNVPNKCKTCKEVAKPTVIFTAGGMGAVGLTRNLHSRRLICCSTGQEPYSSRVAGQWNPVFTS
jgi:hypothetical protein